MEKDFKYFMAELKDISAYPASDFRDKAFDALSTECKELLDTDLPEIKDLKVSVIKDSVGLKGTKVIKEEEETKVLDIFAKDEARFFEKLYRDIENVDTARKYANMGYHEVFTAMTEGRTL